MGPPVVTSVLMASLICCICLANARSLLKKNAECVQASISDVKECFHTAEEVELLCTKAVAIQVDQCLDGCLETGDCSGSKCAHDFLAEYETCQDQGRFTRAKCAQALRVERHRCPNA
ncbi:unnamed protein product [Ostreobium quekettii]|uniref:Uncharacterized protein n=1 Tax=Ostreobium quekettii TaxID=121088 RepID=A0A8S1IRM4_9CHLO|nr:unnamed protein product [Ostreobium quekettii]|eukprot:evm.model.scf_380EXC.3 EVM.evm.TU.scf_380EXC.3   scf_380EXC:31723-32076(-)